MKKDAFYFSHDANAQDDHKCMKLIDQLGMEGYGIFWALVERLRNEQDYRLPLSVCSIYAKRWGTSKEKVEAVVNIYGLFKVEGDYFFSERLIRSMDYKSEKGKKAAAVRWKNASAMQVHTGCIASAMQNDAMKGEEKKEEEIKEEESIEEETPTIQSIIKLLNWHVQDQKKRITGRTLSIEAEKFLDKYKDEPRDSFHPRARKWVKNLYNDPII
jgi:hypothetical protein